MYFQHRHLTSAQSHFFIVLNAVPETGKVLFLSVVTSQLDKAKRRCSIHPPETFVVITPKEYCELSKESAVDCNSYFELSIDEFVEKCSPAKSRKADMPKPVMEKIIKGILKSRLIPPNIKMLVDLAWSNIDEARNNKRNDQS